MTVGALDVSAADVWFTGDINGDAEVNAADFVLNGRMDGGLTINTADLEIDGAILGATRANMAVGSFTGEFGDVRANAADINFSRDSLVDGELFVNAADLMFSGEATNGLDASVRYAEIDGRVSGLTEIQADPGRRPHGRKDGVVVLAGQFDDVEVCARRVVVSGTISGTLNVMADEEPELSNGGTASNINYTPRDGQRCERS